MYASLMAAFLGSGLRDDNPTDIPKSTPAVENLVNVKAVCIVGHHEFIPKRSGQGRATAWVRAREQSSLHDIICSDVIRVAFN